MVDESGHLTDVSTALKCLCLDELLTTYFDSKSSKDYIISKVDSGSLLRISANSTKVIYLLYLTLATLLYSNLP